MNTIFFFFKKRGVRWKKAFIAQDNLWKLKETKLVPNVCYLTNVKSVLIYGSETWKKMLIILNKWHTFFKCPMSLDLQGKVFAEHKLLLSLSLHFVVLVVAVFACNLLYSVKESLLTWEMAGFWICLWISSIAHGE